MTYAKEGRNATTFTVGEEFEQIYPEMMEWCKNKTELHGNRLLSFYATNPQFDYIEERRKEDPDLHSEADVVLRGIHLLLRLLRHVHPEPTELFITRLNFMRMGLLLDQLSWESERKEKRYALDFITEEIPQEEAKEEAPSPQEEEEYLKQLVRSVMTGEEKKKEKDEEKRKKERNPYASEIAGVGFNGGVYHR